MQTNLFIFDSIFKSEKVFKNIEFSKLSKIFYKYEESGRKMNAKHKLGAGSSQTSFGFIIFPSFKMTYYPSVSFLQ